MGVLGVLWGCSGEDPGCSGPVPDFTDTQILQIGEIIIDGLPSFMHFSAVEPPVTLATYTPLKPPVHILPPTTLIPNSEPVINAAILKAGER